MKSKMQLTVLRSSGLLGAGCRMKCSQSVDATDEEDEDDGEDGEELTPPPS